MKKLAFLLILLASLSASAQKRTDTLPAMTDSLRFLSIRDISRLAEPYKERLNYVQYSSFLQVMQAIISEAVAEYQKQAATKPPALQSGTKAK